jgi:stage III sporulation protein SpoIIIAA
MTEFKLWATDSGGNRFVLGTADRAVKAIGMLNAVKNRKLPVRDVEVQDEEGRAIDPVKLRQMAECEVQGIAMQRAFGETKPDEPAR